MGKWDRWCRTKGHPASCSCVYPTEIIPAKGEDPVPYPNVKKEA